MKKIIVIIIILVVVYLASYLYFGGFLVGYGNQHFIVYKYACADLCPQQGTWYQKYFGNISYDQCLAMDGSPKLVGFIQLGPDGKPGVGSIGGYDGCKVK